MAKMISCREVGLFTDCDEVMRGEADEDVMRAAEHGRRRHGMTDEQVGDPSMEQQIHGFIREE